MKPNALTVILTLVILLGLALWGLSPQRSVEPEAGVVELSFMGPSGYERPGCQEALREFERLSDERHLADPSYPRYRVLFGQSAAGSITEDPTRFLVSLAGGAPPDVVYFDRFAISEWAARGAFERLEPYLARDEEKWGAWTRAASSAVGGASVLPPWPGAQDDPPRVRGLSPEPAIIPIRAGDYYEACWNEAVYLDPGGQRSGLYGIPCNADDRALLYNKDLLIRHGYTNEVGEARPPRTWEELEEMAVRMTERDDRGEIRTIGFIPNYGNSWLYLYGWQAGGEFLSADGRSITLHHPRVAEALEFMTRLYDRLGGAREVYGFQSVFQGNELDPFITGKVAMKIDGVWVMSQIALYGADLNIGASPPPLPAREVAAGRVPITWAGGYSYAIPSTSRQKEGAWELVRFLTSRRALQRMLGYDQLAYLSQGRAYIPRLFPNRDQNRWAWETFIRDSPTLQPKFKEAMAVFHGLLEHARYRPVTVVGQKLWNAQINAMEDAVFHKRAPAEALEYYGARMQSDLHDALHPPEGRVIRSWNWFFVLYAAAVALFVAGVAVWERRRRTSGKADEFAVGQRHETRDGLLFALPWILGFLIFTGGPMLFSVVVSFCRFDIMNPAVFTGLRNYQVMFGGDELFWKSLGNTAFMIIGIPLGLVVGLGMAILLCKEVRGVAVWRTFFYLPSIVPAVASSLLWIWMFNPQGGLLNQALASMGIDGPNWLQDERTSKWALILMGLWSAGGGMIIWIAGLKGISRSYYEAAMMDGASAWQQFRYITLPMLTPYILFNLVMGLIATFQIFTQAFIMTGGGPVNSTMFFAYHLFNHAFRFMNMGYAAAMAWFLFVIVVGLTVAQMRLSKRWVHYEGQ